MLLVSSGNDPRKKKCCAIAQLQEGLLCAHLYGLSHWPSMEAGSQARQLAGILETLPQFSMSFQHVHPLLSPPASVSS